MNPRKSSNLCLSVEENSLLKRRLQKSSKFPPHVRAGIDSIELDDEQYKWYGDDAPSTLEMPRELEVVSATEDSDPTGAARRARGQLFPRAPLLNHTLSSTERSSDAGPRARTAQLGPRQSKRRVARNSDDSDAAAAAVVTRVADNDDDDDTRGGRGAGVVVTPPPPSRRRRRRCGGLLYLFSSSSLRSASPSATPLPAHGLVTMPAPSDVPWQRLLEELPVYHHKPHFLSLLDSFTSEDLCTLSSSGSSVLVYVAQMGSQTASRTAVHTTSRNARCFFPSEIFAR